MLLKQITLKNIRSYIEETIIFPEGSCVLSGDIGSGKSTILFAVEFALFGASRTDLSAESLLRKGATQGSAELTFVLEGQEIIIKRGLKKEKESIKQTAGYIINNDIKKELTPLELKAEIITLLGYPEEFLTKTKNYIYQYTVYTPQEEMKSILQENADIRLDTLRKIFNIDKYKIIRENLQSYLRFMREQMRILETKLEPMEETKQHLQKIKDEENAVQESLQLVEPKLAQKKTELLLQQQKVDLLEHQQRQYQELRHQYNTLQALLGERQEQMQRLIRQKEKLQQENLVLAVPEGVVLEKILTEKKELELRRQSLHNQEIILRERIARTQSQVQQLQQDIIKHTTEISSIPEKEKQIKQLIQDVAQRPMWQDRKKQLEELLFKTAEMITRNETLLAHSLELQEKIKILETCPTCLQKVSAEHKHSIDETEKAKIAQAEHLLFEFKKKKAQIVQEREQLQEQLEQLRTKEALLPRLQAELQQLTEKKNQLHQKEEQSALLIQDNGNFQKELAHLQQEQAVDKINLRLQQLQEIQGLITQKQFLTTRILEVSEQIVQAEQQTALLVSQSSALLQQVQAHPDPTILLQPEKKMLLELAQLEKSFSVQQAQLQIQQQNVQKQKLKLIDILEKLTAHTQELSRRKEMYHWLEEHFLNLAYTLEKQVMLNIHALFNQLFQEWFSILITDEGMASRIDDSFYPIIEQNGYEVAFGLLSGGEKTSAALAYRLALNRVINDVIHQIKTKDLLILDEPTDGFSSEQLDKVREVLEKLNLRQTIIVSHESKIESFVEKVIRIQKEGHVSRVFSGG